MPDIWMDVDAALAEVPVNTMPLIDDTDFKTRETSIAYNASGMDLVWNFSTTAGAFTQTAVTPTTGGDYDWTHQGDGIYTIEIPASGGASINNDTEGFGWFSGVVTGVLPFRGPVIGFRAAGLNNALIDSAYSATRGLSGTALPNAPADAAGGLPISDAGGLDIDTLLARLDAAITTRMATTHIAATAGKVDGVALVDTTTTNTDMRGTDGANTTTPPAATAIRAEIDSNSTLLTAALAESYAANGSAGSAAQLLYAIHQMLMQFGISGTTIDVKKLDNSTTAFEVTLDDDTTPTSAART
jgi:hypothetical protein